MKLGKRLAALAASMAAVVLMSSSQAEAGGNEDTPKVATVTIVPATVTDMPVGKATFGPGAASAISSNVTASWVCTVYASDIWQDGDWAEGEGSQFCSGTGYSPIMIRTQIQRSRWFGWETLKIDTSSWTSAYMVTLLPGYDCSDDGNHEYRLVTTGWAEGGIYSGEVQSLNYVRFTC